MPVLNEEQIHELNFILNILNKIDYFDKKRYDWLYKYINHREHRSTCEYALFNCLLSIIYQKKDEYETEYLIDINEFIPEYSIDDIIFFKKYIITLANCKNNPLDRNRYMWLLCNIHTMPYDKDYISEFGNSNMSNHLKQGIDRIDAYHQFDSCWVSILFDE